MIPIVLIALGLFLIFIGAGVHKKQQEAHKAFQSIITDAELFQLIYQMNHFIDAQQLAEATGVEEKRAKKHLAYLSQSRVIRSLYDEGMMPTGVYQMAEAVPTEAIPAMQVQYMSESEIIAAILHYSPDYEVTLAELSVIFNIDVDAAKALRKRLAKAKKIQRVLKDMQYIYVVVPALRTHQDGHSNKNNLKKELEKLRSRSIPSQPRSPERIKIPDADVIQYAIENNGRLTPTLLCLKGKISIEEAKYKLEELYEQGAFVMDLDDSNYVMEYQLRDQSLLH
jgi:hypothetical protein